MNTAIVKFLKDTALAIVLRVPWSVVIERFCTRLLVWSLRKLSSLTTNDLDDQFVEEVIEHLTEARLPKAKE